VKRKEPGWTTRFPNAISLEKPWQQSQLTITGQCAFLELRRLETRFGDLRQAKTLQATSAFSETKLVAFA
jgi:hypothetical protein